MARKQPRNAQACCSPGEPCSDRPVLEERPLLSFVDAVKVMARVQLGVTLTDADTRDIVTFLESLTGELPTNFRATPALPPGPVIKGR